MKKLLFILLLLFSFPALAQTGNGGNPNTFYLTIPYQVNYGNTNVNTNSISLSSQIINPAIRNLIILVAGQSNIADVAPTAYIPTNANKIDNFNIFDGAIYAAADPLIGCTFFANVAIGNPILILADILLQANKFDRVIIVPMAVGATSIQDWATGFLNTRISTAMQRLAVRGIASSTPNATIIGLLGQGETNTTQGTSQLVYFNNISTFISASRAAGFTGKWFIAKQSWDGAIFSSSVQAAQAQVINHNTGIWAGPDADSLVGNVCVGSTACRNAIDLVHWTDTGSASYAIGWNTALTNSGAPFN